jgi:hypothetical protein
MPIALTENDRQSDIEHQDDLLLGKTRDELTERELNEMVHGWMRVVYQRCRWKYDFFFSFIFFLGRSFEFIVLKYVLI